MNDKAKHLGGNLWSINRSIISYSDGSLKEGKHLQFINPRRISPKHALGYTKESMEELREAIRTQGLQSPLVLNSPEDEVGSANLKLLAGERRLRCLDALLQADADCWDQEKKCWVKASKLYNMIECRAHINLPLKDQYKYAISENDDREGIGEGAQVALVKMFLGEGWSEQDIKTTIGRSITWLKDSIRLCDLDDLCFEALASGEINRTVALKLREEEDIRERQKKFHLSQKMKLERIKMLVEKATCKLEEAQAEEAAIRGEVSALLQKKTPKMVIKRVKANLEEAQEVVAEKQGIITEIQINAHITGKDYDKAVKIIEPESTKELTRAKIEKIWLTEIDQIVKSNGKGYEGVNVHDARLVRTIWNSIQYGDQDIVRILRDHNRKNK